MASPQRMEWRRRWPRRAVHNLLWYGAMSLAVTGVFWLLFGDEPWQVIDGSANPLAILPPLATVMAGLGIVAMAVPVLRRPGVAADHDALFISTGIGRRLVLPWSGVSEIAVLYSGEEGYLAIRQTGELSGERGGGVGWLERRPLRELTRREPGRAWARYHAVVPLEDFTGSVSAHLRALAAFAPDSVAFESGSIR